MRPLSALASTLLLVGVSTLAAVAAGAADPDVEEWEVREIPEPSGVVYNSERKTLFVAGDEGDVGELSTDGKLLQRRHLGGDLEGITYDPANGLLYIVREGVDVILEVRPKDLTVTREIPIERAYHGDPNYLRAGGDGVEGITYRPPAGEGEMGTFYVVNQFDPPVLAEIGASPASSKTKTATIHNAWSMANAPLSDVSWDPVANAFVIVSALWRSAFVVSALGEQLATVHLPGIMQEGLARLPDGTFVIVQDTGGLLKWKPATDPFLTDHRDVGPIPSHAASDESSTH